MEGSHIPVSTAYSEDQASGYDAKRFESVVGQRTHWTEAKQLVRALALMPKDGLVLEVGCGTGRLLIECVKRGYNISGCDASAAMLKRCREKQTQEIGTCTPLYLGEAASMPLPNDAFDLTYAIRVLNQTESPAYACRVIAEMLRVTKPGGYVLTECVNARRPRLWWGRHPTTRLSVDEMVAAGTSAGGRLEAVTGAFFLGMGARNIAGRLGMHLIASLDDYLASWAPRKCARVYVLLRKIADNPVR